MPSISLWYALQLNLLVCSISSYAFYYSGISTTASSFILQYALRHPVSIYYKLKSTACLSVCEVNNTTRLPFYLSYLLNQPLNNSLMYTLIVYITNFALLEKTDPMIQPNATNISLQNSLSSQSCFRGNVLSVCYWITFHFLNYKYTLQNIPSYL